MIKSLALSRFLYALLVASALLWIPGGVRGAEKSRNDSIDKYEQETIEGFTVLVHSDVVGHPADAEAMRRELRSQLKSIRAAVPSGVVSKLAKVCIWVEWEHKPHGAAEFHPSADWLREHGYNPKKARCVEISNTRNFTNWSRKAQPWMLLHELAHAYHFLELGYDHQGVKNAYQQAIDRRLYASVDHVDGTKQRAYATTNEMEYYAELSEAYFGKNDFYPFTRAELEQHDKVGYRLMIDTWGHIEANRDANVSGMPSSQLE